MVYDTGILIWHKLEPQIWHKTLAQASLSTLQVSTLKKNSPIMVYFTRIRTLQCLSNPAQRRPNLQKQYTGSTRSAAGRTPTFHVVSTSAAEVSEAWAGANMAWLQTLALARTWVLSIPWPHKGVKKHGR